MRANRIVWMVATALVALSLPTAADDCCGAPVTERLHDSVCVRDTEIQTPCEPGGETAGSGELT